MKTNFRLNIITKIQLLAIILIILTSCGIATYSVWSERKDRIDELINHSKSLSFMIAEDSEYGIYTHDVKYLDRIIKGVSADENLAYIAIFNRDFKKLISKTIKPSVGNFDFSKSRLFSEKVRNGEVTFNLENGNWIELIKPVANQGLKEIADFNSFDPKSGPLGYVHILLSKEKIDENTMRFIFSVSIITIILVGTGMGVMLILGKRIASPIGQIAQVAREVAEGNFDNQVPICGDNEIGELAKSIQFMLERLISYRNKVTERTLELELLVGESKTLAQKANAANHSKSEFLANMSHELRTPLNHIIGFTELIVGKNCGDINSLQEEYLNDVLHSSRRLLSLINDILDLSKIEAEKMVLDKAAVRIKELLENSLIMVKEKALKHGLQLSLRANCPLDYVLVDERKLKQVMYNLLSNAVKFTPNGGCVEVGTNIIDQPLAGDGSPCGNLLSIWVKDTGIGIEKNDLDRIFDPFEQVESSCSRKFQGTGLGLSLTKKIVELHGGRIHAQSEGKDKGTTFQLTIPLN